MQQRAKTSLRLPILLIFGPAVLFLIAFSLDTAASYLQTHVIEAQETVQTSSDSVGISRGASVGAGLSDDAIGYIVQILDLSALVLRYLSLIAFIPFLVVGLLLYINRQKSRKEVQSNNSGSQNSPPPNYPL